ncbi:MAG: glycosyltransferase family 4 protein [Thermoplasmatales archaeon]
MLTVIYPKVKVLSGNKFYAESILGGLRNAGYQFKSVGIRKIEISLFGKPFGGIASQRIGLMLHRFRDHPIHALVPELSPEGVDIVTIHDIVPFTEKEKFIRNSYDERAYMHMYGNAIKAKVLIASTNIGKEELIKALNIESSRIRVIYEAIDSKRFHYVENNPYPDDGKVHLVTVGDFNPRKRFDILYDLASRNKDWTLYHIGPVNSWTSRYRELRQFASNYGNIRILGPKPDEELRAYLSHADLFVYASDAEGFGLPPIEALACGTNVVVNDLPVFRETLDGVAFISPMEKMEETIARALATRKERNTLIEYASRFFLEREIDQLIDLYNEFENEK